jgi:hypothetical protein
MAKSNKERQREWKKKQAAKGKKSITAIVSEDAKTLLDKERKRTGETISGIIERSIINLLAGREKEPVQSLEKAHSVDGWEIKVTAEEKEVYEGISLLKSWMNIAQLTYILNSKKVKPLYGGPKWTHNHVRKLISRVEGKFDMNLT